MALPASSLRIAVWADPAFATQLCDAAVAGDEAMKGEEQAIYSRYCKDCPTLIDVAKKVVFLEERQPAIDQFVEGHALLNASQKDITLTHIDPETHEETKSTVPYALHMDQTGLVMFILLAGFQTFRKVFWGTRFPKIETLFVVLHYFSGK